MAEAASKDAATSSSEPKAQLAETIAQATLQYAIKNYNAAAELYSEATELQAEINGEMAPQNADLLYSYGRCLYHVGVSNSNVLGGKVAGEKAPERTSQQKKGKRKITTAANGEGSATAATDGAGARLSTEDGKVAEEAVTHVVEERSGTKDSTKGDAPKPANQPYFQFTGDENWDTSDESADEGEDADGEDRGAEADAEEEDDDFATAYEILDLARVLFIRQLEEAEAQDPSKGKGKAISTDVSHASDKTKHIKERLADTHDLQAEISLENERFTDAITDSQAALTLKQELFPQESSLIAEAHFKLALALEFASVTTVKGEDSQEGQQQKDGTTDAQVDEGMRKQAASEMEAAIESCRLRVKKEEAILAEGDGAGGDSTPEGGKAQKKVTRQSIDDVKEMISEMEQRLTELLAPTLPLPLGLSSNPSQGPAGAPSADPNPLSGILGSLLGESPAQQQARLDEASKSANDLTGLVRRKRPAEKSSPVGDDGDPEGNGVDDELKRNGNGSAKRARTEEAS
ncbi:MAG: hypothetical protein M1819_000990 [Sarea resinae]|nr:MAG: hypothetical protein M1819_000990 [Sarea resinae]